MKNGQSRLFTRTETCPFVDKRVHLHGTQTYESAGILGPVIKAGCSNSTECIARHGSLINIPTCMVHNLVPKSR